MLLSKSLLVASAVSFFGSPAMASDVSYVVNCTEVNPLNPQLCTLQNPIDAQLVRPAGFLDYVIEVKAPLSHCSDVAYYLRWANSSTPTLWNRFLNVTGRIQTPTQRIVPGGSQLLFMQGASDSVVVRLDGAQGFLGGCNSGQLFSFGIELTSRGVIH